MESRLDHFPILLTTMVLLGHVEGYLDEIEHEEDTPKVLGWFAIPCTCACGETNQST